MRQIGAARLTEAKLASVCDGNRIGAWIKGKRARECHRGDQFRRADKCQRLVITVISASEVTVITGKLAGPFLTEFFDEVDKPGKVNVVILDKEIADLITHEDLESVPLDDVKRRVLIPFGALVQDGQASKILSKDGFKRKVVRGPKLLTHPYYENVSFNKDQLIKYEYKSFKELIDIING